MIHRFAPYALGLLFAMGSMASAGVPIGTTPGEGELQTKGASPLALSQLQPADIPNTQGNTAVSAGFVKPENRTAHALIMTIGDYQGTIPKLKGVPFDTASAKEIARRMGVPAENMTALRDAELTLDGMRRALSDLESKLSGNDQVFIYYSGHGSRQLVQDAEGERCAESLVTVDGQGLFDHELESRLRQLSQKAQKTIVFFDACHSGGLAARSASTPLFSAKSYTPAGLSCSKPSNLLARSIILSKVEGSGGSNLVHIAASKADEVSLDQPGRGGLATQAWLRCLAGDAVDTKGSGGITAEEIRACAQDKIDAQLRGAAGFAPHHVTVTGNTGAVLSYAASPVAAPQAPDAASTSAVAATTEVPAQAAVATLMNIYNSRDDRRLVTVTTGKSPLKIGRDTLDLVVTSRESGYLYLLMVGSDGREFDLLFPNKLDSNNQIAAGASLQLPSRSWEVKAGGPPGRDMLLAIVTDAPRDFSDAGLRPAGPFSIAPAHQAKSIQLVTGNARGADSEECSDPVALRNLVVKKRCSTSYGAALVSVDEVP